MNYHCDILYFLMNVLTHWPYGGGEIIFQAHSMNWYLEHLCNWSEVMPQNPIDDKSTLVQVMAWCHQAPSHYLSQCWPKSMSPYLYGSDDNNTWQVDWEINAKYQNIIPIFYFIGGETPEYACGSRGPEVQLRPVWPSTSPSRSWHQN